MGSVSALRPTAGLLALAGLLVVCHAHGLTVYAADADEAAIIRKSSEQMTAAFNSGKAKDVAGSFLPNGELIDEAGTVYQGKPEIESLLQAFFARYPKAKLTVQIESIRLVGSIGMDEGTRVITTADGAVRAQFRYLGVWAKTADGWKLASYRDFADDPAPTAHERLAAIGWIVGDWINEGADGKVAISYRWSDDKNFLLGEFEMNSPATGPRKTTQRIGWDPAEGRVRSWLFDSDGGFAEGIWAIADDGAVIRSSSVNPDGTTAHVTLNVVRKDKDHFSIAGTDRVIGDSLEDDFEITVTRRPVAAGK